MAIKTTKKADKLAIKIELIEAEISSSILVMANPWITKLSNMATGIINPRTKGIRHITKHKND